MKNQITVRLLRRLGILYGFIIIILNLLGYLIVSKQTMPILQDEAQTYWIYFMERNNALIIFLSIMTFVIPSIACISYIFFVKEKNVAGRIINIAGMYSLFGCSGWILTFLMQLGFLIFIQITEGINMRSVAITSFLNIVQCSIFIGTLSFMCLNSLQRGYVFPKFFPNGKLNQYQGSRQISTGLIFTILYLSVGIFPVFYLISSFRNYSINLGFEIEPLIYYMIIGIVILGSIILITVAYYFTAPLKRLKQATEHIKKGHYKQSVDVVSNDDFGDLSDNFNSMSEALEEKSQRIISIQNSIICGMAMMVESRDNSTGGHINRTSECVRVFLAQMKKSGQFEISDSFEQALIKAAPMHDLGKIAVDDAILRKPGRFENDEFEKMKKHAEEGARIVAEVLRESDDEEFKQIAVNVAHFHHEKWDGSGYPTHICGTDIPYEARIMALADVFDALVSKRCYKESMGYEKAFSIIEESLGQHFDPKLGAFFLTCRPELEELYDNLPE